MNKIILAVAALLLAGWAYYFQMDAGREVSKAARVVTAQSVTAPPVPAPPVPPLPLVVSEAPVSTQPAPASVTTSAPDTRPEWIRNPPELGLTRTLTGGQAVSYDGRTRTVLGTKEGSTQPVLLVRDEASGQIDYFQSGLTFRLKPGADFEAFIRERKAMQRSFSNSDYATVLVDAGSIAGEYNALQNDPRVTLVTFLKLKTLTNPR